MSDIDAYIATMGKGLSGGGGGYITGSYPVITWLKQRSRTYIFSNALPPTTASCAREALRIFAKRPGMFDEHKEKAHRFRDGMRKVGFEIMGNDDCPICPVFTKDELLARELELALLKRGIYTIAVGYPVMEIGTARIRVIITMGHTDAMIDKAIKIFKATADDIGYWDKFNNYDANMKAKLRRYTVVNWLKSWFVPQDA
jgi:glycine C-acetyltransferase